MPRDVSTGVITSQLDFLTDIATATTIRRTDFDTYNDDLIAAVSAASVELAQLVRANQLARTLATVNPGRIADSAISGGQSTWKILLTDAASAGGVTFGSFDLLSSAAYSISFKAILTGAASQDVVVSLDTTPALSSTITVSGSGSTYTYANFAPSTDETGVSLTFAPPSGLALGSGVQLEIYDIKFETSPRVTSYVEAATDALSVLNDYLPLTGGTLTGEAIFQDAANTGARKLEISDSSGTVRFRLNWDDDDDATLTVLNSASSVVASMNMSAQGIVATDADHTNKALAYREEAPRVYYDSSDSSIKSEHLQRSASVAVADNELVHGVVRRTGTGTTLVAAGESCRAPFVLSDNDTSHLITTSGVTNAGCYMPGARARVSLTHAGGGANSAQNLFVVPDIMLGRLLVLLDDATHLCAIADVKWDGTTFTASNLVSESDGDVSSIAFDVSSSFVRVSFVSNTAISGADLFWELDGFAYKR